MYENGRGVPQDYAAAVSWYRKAAEQGRAYAQGALANMYYFGRGVPQDYAAAVSWCRKAADQGDPFAMSLLGNMYARGLGVPQDYVQAHKWFNLAISRHAAAQKEKREIDVKNRDAVSASMTPTQIAEAQRQASEWTPKHTKSAGPIDRNGQGRRTFVVPVLINNAITLDFVVDSGATDVSIPEDVVITLMRAGTIQAADFRGREDLYPC